MKLLWEQSEKGGPLEADVQPVQDIVIRITDEFILPNEGAYVVYDSRLPLDANSANQRKIKDVFT